MEWSSGQRWQAVAAAHDLISTQCFPPDDPGFAILVERAIQDPGVRNGEGVDPRRLEDWLRRTFPRVRVQPRSSLADLGGWGTTWYVYRDGHYEARPAPDRWWLDPSLPRVLVDAGGACVDANRAALEALGLVDHELAGRSAFEIVAPDARAYFATLPGLAREHGSVDTATVLQRPGGDRVEVAVHVSLDPRTGHRLIVFRQI